MATPASRGPSQDATLSHPIWVLIYGCFDRADALSAADQCARVDRTLFAVPSRFFRRRWDESRGDEFDGWGHSAWYFEVGLGEMWLEHVAYLSEQGRRDGQERFCRIRYSSTGPGSRECSSMRCHARPVTVLSRRVREFRFLIRDRDTTYSAAFERCSTPKASTSCACQPSAVPVVVGQDGARALGRHISLIVPALEILGCRSLGRRMLAG